MFESLKALEIETSTLFDLFFANNTNLLRFFFFFLIIDLYFIIPAVIIQIFNPTGELVIPTVIAIKVSKSIKVAKTKMATHPVTA